MKILLITKYLIKGSLNSKKSLFSYIILPIICLLLPLLVFNTPEKNKGKLNLTIVDSDNSIESNHLIKTLKEQYKFNTYTTDLTTARENLIFDKTSSIIIIPENFQEDLINKKQPKVELIYLNEKEEIPVIKNILNGYLTNLNLLSSANKLNFVIPLNTSITMVNRDSTSKNNVNILQSSLGLMIISMMILANTSFSGFIINRKNNNLARVIRSGLTPSHYLTSYILFSLVICSFQGIFLILLMKIFKVPLEIPYLALYFLFTLISIVAIAFGAFSMSFCKNEDEITILNAVIVFPTCMLSGCLWPMDIMNKFFQNLSLIFPQRHIFIIMNFLQGEMSFRVIFIEVALILLICILFITLSFIQINSKGWKTYK